MFYHFIHQLFKNSFWSGRNEALETATFKTEAKQRVLRGLDWSVKTPKFCHIWSWLKVKHTWWRASQNTAMRFGSTCRTTFFWNHPLFWGSHQIPSFNSLDLSDGMKFINGKSPERLQVYNLLENFTSYAVLKRVENFG